MVALYVLGFFVAGVAAAIGLAAGSDTPQKRWLNAVAPVAMEITVVSVFAWVVILVVLLL